MSGPSTAVDATGADPVTQASRRRTFAIISHPDAGKSTLTEKLLLYADAITQAGAIRGRAGDRGTVSDWMDMEQRRGISIASTVAPFEHRGHRINLVDTPGHADFSEDTYRVLTAVDAALMVLDAAKGVEERTLRLFEVCRAQGIPLLTFVNKCDRPALAPLEILDDVERRIGVRPTPATWPVGDGQEFRGVIDRQRDELVAFERVAGGSTRASEDRRPLDRITAEDPIAARALDELGLLEAEGVVVDPASFLEGASTPVFFGSALWNFGVGQLLDAVVDLAPAPSAHRDAEGDERPLDAPFAGFVFKVQANTDPRHRDRLAYLRVCSGTFRRGAALTNATTGRRFVANHVHEVFGRDRATLDEGHPGDIIALSNARELHVGDTVYEDQPVRFPPIRAFTPELFVVARNLDSSRFKRFRSGLEYLDQEGTIQVLRDADRGDREPILGAVGAMQFEVVVERLRVEFGVEVDLLPTNHTVVRRTNAEGARALRGASRIEVVERRDGAILVLAPDERWLEFVQRQHPDVELRDTEDRD